MHGPADQKGSGRNELRAATKAEWYLGAEGRPACKPLEKMGWRDGNDGRDAWNSM